MKNSCIKRSNINRLVLVLVFLSFVFFSSLGANRYWIGGSGSWQDVSHWSASPTGPGGAVRTGMTGGQGALEPDESARGLLRRIDALQLETTGRFLHQSGDVLPW